MSDNWRKWSSVLVQYNIHPEMREQVATKMEKFFRKLSDQVDRGGFDGDIGQETRDGINRIVHQYDRRENTVG